MIEQDSQMPDSCDVVIIGAGAGGLTAAALLSRTGLNVVVLEAESQAGGYLAGFKRRGFSFNTSIEWLNQCGPGGFVDTIFRFIGTDPPHCQQMHSIRRFKSETYDYILTSNPNELRDCLINDFPEETRGTTDLFNDGKKLGRRMSSLERKTVSADTLNLFEKSVRCMKMLYFAIPVINYIRTPIEKALCRYFNTEGVRNIFSTHQTLMSLMVSIGWAYSGNFQACPKGGSRTLAVWLADRIRIAGSKIILNQRVARVKLNDKKEASGVILEDNRTINSRFVIAACDIRILYEKMLPVGTIARSLHKALEESDIYHSVFCIFLGIDCDPTALGFGEEALNLVRDDVKGKDHSGGDPRLSVITVLAPSILDPSLAPQGKGTLIIHCPAYLDFQKNWQTGEGLTRGKEYLALKKEYADILLDRIETTFAPGLRQHIEVMEIATPITYWRYTGNTMGTICGVKPTAKNIRAGVAHHQTAVKRLLIGGHCAEYGGGVPIAVKAAANASLIVLKEMNRKEYSRLKAVMSR